MKLEETLIEKASRNSAHTTLLLLDRREDPVTPLLNQWTYQAMIHELLGLNKNRVDLSHLSSLSQEMKEVVLCQQEDPFFRKIMHKNMGESAEAIHNLVNEFLKNKNSNAQMASIEDMQRVLEQFPEFKKSQRVSTKHFNVLQEIIKLVEGRNLYDVSSVEQDIAGGKDNRNDHFRDLNEQINNPSVSKLEKLRLLCLYSVRYENDDKIFQIKEQLRKQGMSEQELKLSDLLVNFAGKTKRSGDLFSNKNLAAKGRNLISGFFKEVKDVFS